MPERIPALAPFPHTVPPDVCPEIEARVDSVSKESSIFGTIRAIIFFGMPPAGPDLCEWFSSALGKCPRFWPQADIEMGGVMERPERSRRGLRGELEDAPGKQGVRECRAGP